MKKKVAFNKNLTQKIANLSKLNLDEKEKDYLTSQFNKTLDTISNLNKVDTKKIKEISNVTGLGNVFREDEIEQNRVLSQDESLANAKKVHNGYFVVKGIFDEK